MIYLHHLGRVSNNQLVLDFDKLRAYAIISRLTTERIVREYIAFEEIEGRWNNFKNYLSKQRLEKRGKMQSGKERERSQQNGRFKFKYISNYIKCK